MRKRLTNCGRIRLANAQFLDTDVGIERMDMRRIMALLTVTMTGWALAGELLVSAWSAPLNGLMIQEVSPVSFFLT